MNYNKLTVSTVPSTLTPGVSQAFLMSIGDANSSLIRRQLNLLQCLSRHCPLCIIYLYPQSFNMAGHFVCARLAEWRLMEEPGRSCRRRHEALASRPHAGLRKYCAFTRKPLPVICNESFYLREENKWNSCVLRYDTIGRTELIPSIVLSSDNTNYRNIIQLFLQLFDELSVYRDYH